jgi:hypothetical protein
VYEALRTLPDNVYVFHSLRWIRAPGTSVAPQGESDFLIFDPDRGLLVIEVKSGGIHVDAGYWYHNDLYGVTSRLLGGVFDAI